MSASARFKLQRLRSMSPAEVAWRVRQRVALAWWSRRAGRPAPRLDAPAGGFRAAFLAASAPLAPADSPAAFARALDAACPGAVARTIAAAEDVLRGRVTLFDRGFELGPDPAQWPWNRSPDGGPDAGSGFGPTLDYRDPARVGDARLAWELGRHGMLPVVAQAAFLTGDPRFAGFVIETLEAWCRACPPYAGIQWASALEYALRSLAWGFTLALVARTEAGAAVSEERWERLLATWAEQLRFVAHHDARYSSANNHRLGEAAGLALGGRLLAFVPGAPAWHARGLAVLEESFLAQTTDDGVTREHAFQYQHFVLDFVVVVEALEARAGRAVPPAIAARIARVADRLALFSPGGVAWPVGDGDEGQALPTGEPFAERVAASLECARGLTGGAWRARRSARARWLGLGGAAHGADSAPSALPAESVAAGYVVLACATPVGSARLLFDAAELGLPPLYAHGHADALMVLLDVNGPRLVDPGTGGYHAHAVLRERLRATAAHNTVEVDGVSSSVPGGLFQWLAPAHVAGPPERNAEFAYGAAHTGYRRLVGGVIHRREVSWAAPDRIVVVDRLDGVGHHEAVTRWHVGDGEPTLRPVANASPAVATCDVRWPDGIGLVLVAGLPLGAVARASRDAVWAPRFLAPRPCGVVEWRVAGALPQSWSTEIRIVGGADAATPGALQ